MTPRDPNPLIELAELAVSRRFFLQFVINLNEDPGLNINNYDFASAMLNLDLRSVCLALAQELSGNASRYAKRALANLLPLNELSDEALAHQSRAALIRTLKDPLNPLLNLFQSRLSKELSERGWSPNLANNGCSLLRFNTIKGAGFFKVGAAHLPGSPIQTPHQAREAAALMMSSLNEIADKMGAHERVIVCFQRGALGPNEFAAYPENGKSMDERLFCALLRLRETQALEALLPSAPRGSATRSL